MGGGGRKRRGGGEAEASVEAFVLPLLLPCLGTHAQCLECSRLPTSTRTHTGVERVLQDIAGPLCFQGDRLAVGVLMPKAEPGDHVVVADVGAYTLSMYSRCSSTSWAALHRAMHHACVRGG